MEWLGDNGQQQLSLKSCPESQEEATTLKANSYRTLGRGINPPVLQKGCEELFAVHSRALRPLSPGRHMQCGS